MARTKGSGWGGGIILWQLCPNCNKKKVYYAWACYKGYYFWCTSCKQEVKSETLIKQTHR